MISMIVERGISSSKSKVYGVWSSMVDKLLNFVLSAGETRLYERMLMPRAIRCISSHRKNGEPVNVGIDVIKEDTPGIPVSYKVEINSVAAHS
jgi:hypothetical protein